MTPGIPFKAPLALQLYAGMEVDPFAAGLPKQVVQSVEKRDGRVKFTTIHGEWDLDEYDLVTFPRRRDGSVKDWRNADRPPLPREICVRDILSPAELPPDIIRGDKNRSAMWAAASAQIVTGIWMDGTIEHVAIKTFTPIDSQLRVWHFNAFELVTFPKIALPRTRQVDRSRKTYGPYLLKSDPEVVVEFYVHPYGHGRWPGGYDEFFFPSRPGEYKMRPPKLVNDWKKFVPAEGGTTHPNDRGYGSRKKRQPDFPVD